MSGRNRRGVTYVRAKSQRGTDFMAREPKLERLEIPATSRVVKDWFPTRESAEAMIAAIRAHIWQNGRGDYEARAD